MASFHKDLVEIREKSGLNVADIIKKTKIPESLILEIERGTIFDNTGHQKTYIRSFIRSYAKSISIKDEDIIRALDEYDQNLYNGFLSRKYLKKGLEEHAETNEAQDVEVEQEMSDLISSTVRPGPTSTIGAEEYSRPDPTRIYNRTTPPPPKIDSVDWAHVGRRISSFNSGSILIFIAVLVVIGVLIGGYFALNTFFTQDETEEETQLSSVVVPSENQTSATVTPPPIQENTPGETSASATVTSPTVTNTRATTAVTLPDTLFVVVHAAIDKLEPVRVLSDINNTVSPYWIESNEAMRFEFFDQIEIRGQVSRMAIYINDHLIQNFLDYDVGNRTIRLTRDILKENPEWFNSDPEPYPAGFSPPTVVRDRPIF